MTAACGSSAHPQPGPDEARVLSAIADVESGRRAAPVVTKSDAGGDATVTFLVKDASGQVPRIVSDVTGWGEQSDGGFSLTTGRMRRVAQTPWYFLDVAMAPDARIEYLVAHGEMNHAPDPLNPRRAPMHPDNPVSELAMPGYQPPREFADPPVRPAGQVTEDTITSRALAERKRVIVYVPPGHRRETAGYPLAVFFDGTNMVGRGEVPRVVDYLIAHQAIEPIVAVFADADPPGDGYRADATRRFFTVEIPDWAASHLGATREADRRAIVGMSFGARGALDAALGPRDAYGLLGLLIPGRAANVDAITQRHRRLRAAIVAGQYDGPNLSTARRARTALLQAGDEVAWFEVPEGHNPATWRNHMSEMLAALFGQRPGASQPGRR